MNASKSGQESTMTDLHAELDDAVNELVTAVEGLAHE